MKPLICPLNITSHAAPKPDRCETSQIRSSCRARSYASAGRVVTYSERPEVLMLSISVRHLSHSRPDPPDLRDELASRGFLPEDEAAKATVLAADRLSICPSDG